MLTTDQVLNQCLDSTDPNAPAIRTTGGGGAGGSVAVTSIAAGDNNIGNVDIASALPAGTNLIGSVTSPTISGGGGTSAAPTTSSTAIVAADSAREELLIVNTGSVDCYVNHGAAATTSHFLLKAGAALPLSGGLAKRAWNGITASGTAQLHIITGTV